ncbi:MAG: dTMP kinase [Anaerolineae bacterium]|nr:dTMP kinase [Anaerolineae bacterium]
MGFFLVIEGLDGSGKTVIARDLAAHLKAQIGAEKVLLTYEPHDESFSGELIRAVLRKEMTISARTLALAFATNRADHLNKDVEPFLARDGSIVICDRYYLSSLVYQTTKTTPLDYVWQINGGSRPPDLTIFLNASDEVCYQRIGNRGQSRELFEENLHEKRAKYDTAIEFLRNRGERIVEANADGTIPQVLAAVIDVLRQVFPLQSQP